MHHKFSYLTARLGWASGKQYFICVIAFSKSDISFSSCESNSNFGSESVQYSGCLFSDRGGLVYKSTKEVDNKHKASQQRAGKKMQQKPSSSSVTSTRSRGCMDALPSVQGHRFWQGGKFTFPQTKNHTTLGLVHRIQTVNFLGGTQDKSHHEFSRDHLWVIEWAGVIAECSELFGCVQSSRNKKSWFMCEFTQHFVLVHNAAFI